MKDAGVVGLETWDSP